MDIITTYAGGFEIAMPGVTVDLRPYVSPQVEMALTDWPAPVEPQAHDTGRMALDRGNTLRTKDINGRLHVRDCRISKANVCPYMGCEIPHSERLGLDPGKVYQLYRDAQHLEAAVPLFERIPLMMNHVSSTADVPNKEIIIGAISNVRWQAPYVMADLTVWDREGIAAIESEAQQELSPGYNYDPVMTSGNHEGKNYDGRMTAIVPNHLAIVSVGRTGPDVMVNDGVAK